MKVRVKIIDILSASLCSAFSCHAMCNIERNLTISLKTQGHSFLSSSCKSSSRLAISSSAQGKQPMALCPRAEHAAVSIDESMRKGSCSGGFLTCHRNESHAGASQSSAGRGMTQPIHLTDGKPEVQRC